MKTITIILLLVCVSCSSPSTSTIPESFLRDTRELLMRKDVLISNQQHLMDSMVVTIEYLNNEIKTMYMDMQVITKKTRSDAFHVGYLMCLSAIQNKGMNPYYSRKQFSIDSAMFEK